MIKRISSLKHFGFFHNFAWDTDNLINGRKKK